MLTQQDILNRLNQLTLKYNLTWFDVKYDADKAITKINNFLGTKYPKLSEKLISPESTYSITTSYLYAYVVNNVQYQAPSVVELQEKVTAAGGPNPMVTANIINLNDEYEIIAEEYFHSVIIPYIAMEVLSRDEEFTTIYNKYMTEMQEGLYDMFQKEFNRVPFEFRQNPDQGVFFGLDTAQGIIQHNERNLNIPTFKFKISYYPNNNAINVTNTFINDPGSYAYGKPAKLQFLLAPNNTYYSTDGTEIYTFRGWSRELSPNGLTQGSSYLPVFVNGELQDTLVTMSSNLNLYATWDRAFVLDCTVAGVVSIVAGNNNVNRNNISNLIIPEYVKGRPVITIPTLFLNNDAGTLPSQQDDQLVNSIYLPTSVDTISERGFKHFRGTRITLNEGLLSIGANAFASTPNLVEIIIPASVTTISAGAFPVVPYKHLVIKVRTLQSNKPDGWAGTIQAPTWYAATDLAQNYSVEVIWGYNGS
jgi:hypothetical protein